MKTVPNKNATIHGSGQKVSILMEPVGATFPKANSKSPLKWWQRETTDDPFLLGQSGAYLQGLHILVFVGEVFEFLKGNPFVSVKKSCSA